MVLVLGRAKCGRRVSCVTYLDAPIGAQASPYDLPDAVTYIHQCIRSQGNRPVPIPTVIGWACRWRHENTENILTNRVNAGYRRRYGANAFTAR